MTTTAITAPQPTIAPIDQLAKLVQLLTDAGYVVIDARACPVVGSEWRLAPGAPRAIAAEILDGIAHPHHRPCYDDGEQFGRAVAWVAGRHDRPALRVFAKVDWPELRCDEATWDAGDGPEQWGEVVSIDAVIDWQLLDDAGCVIPRQEDRS